ncbi:MAG TPA: hypothetical protein VMJ10_33095, partial [Kofleriaceae bacterium]|nr:hypothetical protein [Kofleriaceae bacterium]
SCPSGFGCVSDGAGSNSGVCFPGADNGGDSSTGCDASGSGAPTGPILLGLGVAVMVVSRRRPNKK